ncbi:MAG TPA: sigma-70 family RNA polymerase sigma factor [Candidatus Polarisedimenticolaceae bacterium]|nr:sigma-70 family RNA polymerase sigma factor [Candidatus Polarisedimenticolaceae bacterium]
MLIPWFQREVSIDDYTGPEATRSLESFLVDPEAESQEQKIYRKELTHLVREALVHLDDRERHIIRNRFGLLGGNERTLEEIAAGLNLSRERVRQLERIAKTKLRKTLVCCSPTPLLSEL